MHTITKEVIYLSLPLNFCFVFVLLFCWPIRVTSLASNLTRVDSVQKNDGFGITYFYFLSFYFILFFFDIGAKELFFFIRKFQKKLGILVNLFMSLALFLYCFVSLFYIRFVDFYCEMRI
jgi:hypothetical protein